jgi:hypothetical protein
MADPYRVVLHPDLARQRAELEASATDMSPTKNADDRARDAHRLSQLDKGLDALAEGRESEFSGKRMQSMLTTYPEIGDHAELKIPVTVDLKPNGQPYTSPSDRLTYQEAEPRSDDTDRRPIRRAVAFEPRQGGQPFRVTGQRHGRAVGVGIQELDDARAKENATGTETTPVRMTGDSELATAIRAGTNPGYHKGTVSAPKEAPVASNAATQDKTKQQQTQLTQGGN